ncbi:MAG: molybdate ABC transporter substrate-binding protein [Acidobacteriota bacterium]|nr:MAG: molybdate ABC transporter substrate-binding protein [Acidobacteriota bacterium]
MRSLLLLLVGFGASAEATLPTEPIRIFAAASLTDALSAVIADFEKAHPSSRVVSQFGGSSDLARQIIAGAPADLFFSADRRQMDRIVVEGFIINNERSDVLSNELVVVRHRDRRDTVDEPGDLEALGRIAMADPEVVPAGVYARQYLESQGLWSRLRKKVVPTLDVRGALAAVASGNVDAGMVYRTDAAIEDRVKIVYTVPREEGPPIVYALGMIEARQREDVRTLYDYLRSEAACEVFERFGFVFLGQEP